MKRNSEEHVDLVIVGAGPAGLTAGIQAVKSGLSAVVLEKGEVAGPLPRGEGVNRYPLLEDLLGGDFFDEHCYRMDGSLVFRSPQDLKRVRLPGKQDIFFYDWRTFMDRLAARAEEAGVDVRYRSRVLGPVEGGNHICSGVMVRTANGAVHQFRGRAVLACDGHKSLIGRHYGIDYDSLNCAMVKCIVNNANIDIDAHPELQFYVIGNGDLIYAPNFPPSVAYAFPLGGKKMELGLMLRMMQAHRMTRTVRIPGPRGFFSVWKRLKAEYPGFSEYFRGAEIEYELVTALSNARMVADVIPVKGVVLIGDSAGFIDPFGSSGIYSGMAMATFWVDLLANEIRQLSEDGADAGTSLWDAASISRYLKAFRRTGIYKRINGSYGLIGKFEWYIFKHLRTAERINHRWGLISWMLRKAA